MPTDESAVQPQSRQELRTAMRRDRDLNSYYYYGEGMVNRIGATVVLGTMGLVIGNGLYPELTWLFLLPAAGSAAMAAQSFKLSYLERIKRSTSGKAKGLEP